MITKTVYLVETPTWAHTYTDWDEAMTAYRTRKEEGEAVTLYCYDCHEC